MRVLIIRCGALGDLVYATSVIDALKLEYGTDTLIDFVCTPGSGMLFMQDPRVNKVFPLKHKRIPLIFSKQKRAVISHSKKEPYDILINFEYGKQFTSLVQNIKASNKVGAIVENIIIAKDINRGEAQKEFFKSVVSLENIKKSFPNVASLNFSEVADKFSLTQPYIVLAPSNSHVNRRGINYRAWENQKWKELISQLAQEIMIVIVGAKGEESFFQNIEPYPSNVIDLVGENNIIELNSIIKHANCIICTDSAVGHISAAVNTPVFILMGPNNPKTDAPYSSSKNSVNIITLEMECSPCYKTEIMEQCKDNICMKNISTSMIFNRIKSANLL